jgi:membrane fusion protein, multidrug efflux system
MTRKTLLPLLLLAGLAACNDKPAEKRGAPPTLITVTQASVEKLEIIEHTLGTLEAVKDPKIAAEVPGQIIKVLARSGKAVRAGDLLAEIDATDIRNQARADAAEIARLNALLAQQERVVTRQGELVQKNFISKNALDDISAQRDALKSQLDAAQARAALSGNNLKKTRVLAPFDGIIEVQIVSVGDYVKVGDTLFRMVSNDRLRANLPFPESAGPRLKIGQPVRLSSPLDPTSIIEGVVEDIQPTVSEGSRALNVISRINNPGFLMGGGSVNASIVTATRDNAILVPEESVVLRPAGRVVYRVSAGKALQQVVEMGARQGGKVEILSGLQGGETIVLDGAGFLTDQAAVSIKGAAKPAAQ